MRGHHGPVAAAAVIVLAEQALADVSAWLGTWRAGEDGTAHRP
jgi:hypothetical protein